MTRENIIKNLLSTYSKHGVTEKVIEEQIESGLKEGFSYETIYTGLRMVMGNCFNEREYFTPSEIAEALGSTEEEMIEQIESMGKELEEKGEDSNEYFVEVDSSKKQQFMILPGGLN